MMSFDTELQIIETGAELVRANGFNNTGLSSILEASGVPKGSFYYYFSSKHEFGLKLIEYLHKGLAEKFLEYLTGDYDDPPLVRLEYFFGYFRSIFSSEKIKSGCPIGNLSQEMAASNVDFRNKLAEVWSDIEKPVEMCLKRAVETGTIPSDTEVESLSKFIVNSWQGALIALKVQGDEEPLLLFERYIFSELLKCRCITVTDGLPFQQESNHRLE